MLSFKEYFQLNETVQSVELMSTILGRQPILDYWIKEYESSGGEQEWGDLMGFLEESEGINTHDINNLLVNLKLFKAPARAKAILDKATARIPEKFRIILNDMINPDFLGSTKLPDDQMNAIKPSNDLITLIIGPNDDPITVWMISHRIGHGIEQNLNYIHEDVAELVQDYAHEFQHIHGGFTDKGGYGKLSGFRSAATDNVNSFYEYINDVIGQYCHNGRVQFVEVDLSNVDKEEAYWYKFEKNRIETEIGNLIKSALTELHGKVLIF